MPVSWTEISTPMGTGFRDRTEASTSKGVSFKDRSFLCVWVPVSGIEISANMGSSFSDRSFYAYGYQCQGKKFPHLWEPVSGTKKARLNSMPTEALQMSLRVVSV